MKTTVVRDRDLLGTCAAHNSRSRILGQRVLSMEVITKIAKTGDRLTLSFESSLK